MPSRSVADKYNVIVWIFCGQVLQKDIHANCIAIWKNEKAAITRYRINSTVSVSILSNMMAGNTRADSFSAPAMLRFVNTTETRFVLEHEANSLGVVENSGQFMDSGVHFLRRLSPLALRFSDACFSAFFAPAMAVQHIVYLSMPGFVADFFIVGGFYGRDIFIWD